MVNEPFNALLNLVGQDAEKDFYIYVHQGYQSITFFSCSVLVWLWYHGTEASQNEFGSFYSSIFGENFRRNGTSSSLEVWQNSAVKPLGFVVVVVLKWEDFLLLIQFPYFLLSCWDICLCFSLGRLYGSRTNLFLLVIQRKFPYIPFYWALFKNQK